MANKIRIISEEGFHAVRDGEKNLLAVLTRDPVSGKHLVYFTNEGTSADIAEKLIRNDLETGEK